MCPGIFADRETFAKTQDKPRLLALGWDKTGLTNCYNVPDYDIANQDKDIKLHYSHTVSHQLYFLKSVLQLVEIDHDCTSMKNIQLHWIVEYCEV